MVKRLGPAGQRHGLEQYANTMIIEPVGARFLPKSNDSVRNFRSITSSRGRS